MFFAGEAFFLGELFEKSPPNPSKTFKKGFMKTDSEISALSVYAKLYGISDRLPLSLAPAAILVPPPKMAFKIVLVREIFCVILSAGRSP